MFRVFYFRGLRKPRKYFYNENFQIYGSQLAGGNLNSSLRDSGLKTNLIGATMFLELGQVRYRHNNTLAFVASSFIIPCEVT